MMYVSARSNLVIFFPKKNLTSNGSKPIRVLKTKNLVSSDLRLPNYYLLPDFQPHRSNFLLQPTGPPPPPPGPEGRGSTRKKNRAPRTFEPVRIICYGQATCSLTFSQFRFTFDRLFRGR